MLDLWTLVPENALVMRSRLKKLSQVLVAGLSLCLFAAPWGCNSEQIVDNTIIEITDSVNASRFSGSASGLLDTTITTSSGLNETLLGNPAILSTLIRAKSVTTELPRIGSVDISDVYLPCSNGGTASYGGNLAYTVDGNLFDVSGTYSQTLSSCSSVSTVMAADGECDITTEFTGSFSVDYAFNYETDSGDYLIASSLTTTTALDFTKNGTLHSVEIDLFFMQDSATDPSFSGTITVDDIVYDAAIELNAQNFTRAELGCE